MAPPLPPQGPPMDPTQTFDVGSNRVVQPEGYDLQPREGRAYNDPEHEPDEKRRALVSAWEERVIGAKSHWEKPFKRMKKDADFCFGLQWSDNFDDDRYVANVTLRTVQQKTAFLYAKNPKSVAKRRERILHTAWDGTESQLQTLAQTGAAMMQGGPQMGPGQGGLMGPVPGGASPPGMPPGGAGMPPSAVPGGMGAQPGLPGMELQGMGGVDPMIAAPAQQGLQIAMDAGSVKAESRQMELMGKTLELLYEYNISEQAHPFKQMMKMLVRRTITTGVGYIKIAFQRNLGRRPEIEARIKDAGERLAVLERLAESLRDTDTPMDENSAEMEQLRVLMQDLQTQVEFVVREGLIFDYPGSTQVIPDPKCIRLREFLGADWVAQEFILSKDEVKEIYGVDLGDKYTAYTRPDGGKSLDQRVHEIMAGSGKGLGKTEKEAACVWEIYSRRDGLVYVVCSGYCDFLREPQSPDVQLERFYPWFALAFNEVENEDHIYPPSDVSLMRAQQMEYNRARQGLREHRVAARPKTLVSAGVLDEEDTQKLENHVNNAVIELNGLQPGQDVKTVLQPWAGPGIDPNLYEINPIWEDIQRTTGISEANAGVNSQGTATESQIAEASRQTSMGSNIDDLDDLLTQLAKAGGQILLKEVSQDTVKRVIGPGAVWPELSRQQIAEEIWLEIEAGSTGKPNQAQEIANMERLAPLLFQLPNIDPEFLAKELLKRLDDRLDLTLAFKSMLPSIVAMNAARPAAPGAGPVQGAAQGPAGMSNGAKPPGLAGSPPPDQVGMLAGMGPPVGPMQ
jgi:hypothetical protein